MSLTGNAESGILRGTINTCGILTISAYGIAVKNGFKGTEKEWLASLTGKDGIPGIYTLGVGETLENAPDWAQVVLDPDTESPELEMVVTFQDGTTATYTIFGEVVG